jgi:hypothetical protein
MTDEAIYEEGDRPSRGLSRLHSASRIFGLLGFLKLVTFSFALQLVRGATKPVIGSPAMREMFAANPQLFTVGIAVWYGLSAALSVAIAVALHRRRIWGRDAGVVWGVFHVLGIIFVMQMGWIAVLNALLGFIAAVSILVADQFGAFAAPQQPERPA